MTISEDTIDTSVGDMIVCQATTAVSSAGQRLDQAAAEMFPEYSRSQLQTWIKSGELTLDGRQSKPNRKLAGGEKLNINAARQDTGDWQPEDIPLDIVFEDESIIVLNKPSSLVVHPAAGNWTGTLLNGLLHHDPQLIQVPRAGIVHRLDKDTTGLMVIAKRLEAQNHLVKQLQARTVKREYEAYVHGQPKGDGTISTLMGRHPTVRTRMAVLASEAEDPGSQGGKEAISHYRVLENYNNFSHVRVSLETGRTHQIRVHMAHLGYPLVGDPVYGRKINTSLTKNTPHRTAIDAFPRQALHAAQLGLIHPDTGEKCVWQAPLPDDMMNIAEHLLADQS